LDEQRAAFEVVLRAVERSRRGDHKQAIVVTGGPGSGKVDSPERLEQDYGARMAAGFGQVGCIYTAQGFEYDFAGGHPGA
jgi:hypothetical protein